MKRILNIIAVLLIVISVTSCNNHRKPKLRYMAATDMYNAVGYETYATNPFFKNGIEAQKPVEGTIFRGEVPYEIPNTNEGYELAKATLKSPLEVNEKNLAKGKAMFTIYCAVCHGAKGDGQGVLVKREKFLGVPNYKDRQITEGSIYHVIMYGRNLMGSHASQLTYKERWQIVQYVQKLREDSLK
ncbi:MAG: cytochrome c [Lutibacter sp.]|uniref:c-type cytochrome n=1 Tax=Lutibacter sp. TaxID=1925666 RepID=UPI00299E66AB|nr:cytochrome c [Lutibacter sp.]MDX1829434.1 cytochrome c [Lutibacter sp.]